MWTWTATPELRWLTLGIGAYELQQKWVYLDNGNEEWRRVPYAAASHPFPAIKQVTKNGCVWTCNCFQQGGDFARFIDCRAAESDHHNPYAAPASAV